MRLTDAERFWAKVDRSGFCWTWTAQRDRDGYGRFEIAGRRRAAHRVSFEWERGPVPEGREIDHVCRNRACVRPEHLEAVTHHTNVRRGRQTWQGNKCARGHVLTEENIRYHSGDKRQCKSCWLLAHDRARLAALQSREEHRGRLGGAA